LNSKVALAKCPDENYACSTIDEVHPSENAFCIDVHNNLIQAERRERFLPGDECLFETDCTHGSQCNLESKMCET